MDLLPSRDCNTAGICGDFGDGTRRSPSSEDRDEEGRENDAGRFETSRLALPFADASNVGDTITGRNKSASLALTEVSRGERRKRIRVRSVAGS